MDAGNASDDDACRGKSYRRENAGTLSDREIEMPENGNAAVVFETDALDVTAFLMMRGVEMLRFVEVREKTVWYFKDAKAEGGMTRCHTLYVEFLNSECKRYDSFVRDLKKMLRKGNRGKLRH